MISAEMAAALERLEREPRRFRLPFVLPGRNELDAARGVSWPINGSKSGRRQNRYNEIKSKVQSDIALFVTAAHLPRAEGRVLIACNWREPNRVRDPDDIVGGGKKLLMDAMAQSRKGNGWNTGAGLLHCDGWHCVAGFIDVITLDRETGGGVDVVVAPVQTELFPRAPLIRGQLRVDAR